MRAGLLIGMIESRKVRSTRWCSAGSSRRLAQCRCCSRPRGCERRLAWPDRLLERAAVQHPAKRAEQHAERRAEQLGEEEARRGGIQPRAARRTRGKVHAHRVRSCRAPDRQPVLGKHHCCSAKGDDAIAIACCNAAKCGLGLEQRARCGVVFIAWRIG